MSVLEMLGSERVRRVGEGEKRREEGEITMSESCSERSECEHSERSTAGTAAHAPCRCRGTIT